MGNSIGVECTNDGVYVTNIFSREKDRNQIRESFRRNKILIDYNVNNSQKKTHKYKLDDTMESHKNIYGNANSNEMNRENEVSKKETRDDISWKQNKFIISENKESIYIGSDNINNKVISSESIKIKKGEEEKGNEDEEEKKEKKTGDVKKKKKMFSFHIEDEKHNNDKMLQNFYLEMQNVFFKYISEVHSIIDDILSIYVIKKEMGKCYEKQVSLMETFKQLKKNDNIKAKSFLNLLHQMPINSSEEKKTEEINKDDNNNDEENLMLICFWSFKKNVLKKLLKKSKKYVRIANFINITGIRANYIKKKIKRLEKLKTWKGLFNLRYHKELKCTNSSIFFLKNFYPNSFFHFLPLNENDEKNDTYGMNDLLDISKCFFFNKEELDNFKLTQIVILKSFVTYYLTNEKGEIAEIGSSTIGKLTISNLWTLLTKQKESFEHVLQLAKDGTNELFDITVADIYGSDYSAIGLKGNVVASIFGKAQNADYLKKNFNANSIEPFHMEKKDIFVKEKQQKNEKKEDEKEQNEEEIKVEEYNDTYHEGSDTKEKNNWDYSNTLHMFCKHENRRKMPNYYSDTCVKCVNAEVNSKDILQKKKRTRNTINKKKYGVIGKNAQKKKSKMKDKNTVFQYDKVHCDLAKSLMSLIAVNISQHSYLNCYIHNIKSIIFVGCMFDNFHFLLAMQQLINFWSNKTVKLCFVQPFRYVSSLGAALHSFQ